MGDGALYTYCRGDEYLNIFPFWDWRKIPGITAYESEAPVPAFFNYGAHVRNKTAFVGGVTDGETGMTAMVLDRDGLQAHKSWIFTRDYVLCLGAGIRSDSILAVTTSVDQRVKRGDLLRYADGNWLPVQGKYVFLLRRNNVSSMITQGIFCYNLPPMWPFRKSDPGAGVILWDHMLLKW